MRYALTAMALAVLAVTSALRIQSTNTAEARPPGDDLPDLTVSWIAPVFDTVEWCKNTAIGANVDVHNIGPGNAGTFVVVLDEWQQTVYGLQAGDDTYVYFPFPEGYHQASEPHAIVDASHLVTESDETNNELIFPFPTPTMAPTCTPGPYPSPTATPTPGLALSLSAVGTPPAGESVIQGDPVSYDYTVVNSYGSEVIAPVVYIYAHNLVDISLDTTSGFCWLCTHPWCVGGGQCYLQNLMPGEGATVSAQGNAQQLDSDPASLSASAHRSTPSWIDSSFPFASPEPVGGIAEAPPAARSGHGRANNLLLAAVVGGAALAAGALFVGRRYSVRRR